MRLRITLGLLIVLLTGAAPASRPADRADRLLAEGQAAAQRGEQSVAIEKYREAIALAPDSPAAHAGLGGSLLAAGQVQDAEPELRRALELEPGNASYQMLSGRAELARGRIDPAEAAYARAAKLSPKTAGTIWSDFASSLAVRNDDHLSARIEAALKRAAEADPPSSDALFTLGQSYVKAAREEGKGYLERYLKLEQSLPKDQQDARRMRLARQMIRALDILKSTEGK